MEDYNWILATIVKDGRQVLVRQTCACSVYWVDEEQHQYDISELDFTTPIENGKALLNFQVDWEKKFKESSEEQERTQKAFQEMIAAMDATKIADHNAKIAERDYWRKLRGDILLSILNKENYSSPENVLSLTDIYLDGVYKQDKFYFGESKDEI